MKKVQIEVEVSGAAFEDAPSGELLRVLTDAARSAAAVIEDGCSWDRVLRDSNGNKVGYVLISVGS